MPGQTIEPNSMINHTNRNRVSGYKNDDIVACQPEVASIRYTKIQALKTGCRFFNYLRYVWEARTSGNETP
jgi:hypothetical protein